MERGIFSSRSWWLGNSNSIVTVSVCIINTAEEEIEGKLAKAADAHRMGILAEDGASMISNTSGALGYSPQCQQRNRWWLNNANQS